jgi:hypothetical protein
VRIKIRLFGDITQAFAISDKILLDVAAVKMDFSICWLE